LAQTGSFAWFVARRYLTAKRKQAFISLISGVSILGVAVGVAATIIALALMTGLQTEMRDRIVSSAAHLYIYKYPSADPSFSTFDADAAVAIATPGVTGVAPAVIGKAMVQASGNAQQFVTLKGIDITREPTVTAIVAGMRAGSLDALVNRTEEQPSGIILGVDLAASLGAHVGDRLTVITPEGPISPSGRMTGRRSFEVVGTFQLGLYELDSGYAFIALPVAMEFLHRQGPDLMQARVADMFKAAEIGDALAAKLGSMYTVENWTEMNKALYSALILEKIAISLTIGLVVVVAALNIVASLVLLVMEKSRDIAILRTMGAPAQAIRLIFMLQGLVIGAVGTFAGAALGLGVSFICDRYQLITLPGEVYQITHVPFRVEPLDVTIVIVAAIVICWLATIYPARRAGQLDPAEALRYQ
jgi:lipoprotein-releasing system permease protein